MGRANDLNMMVRMVFLFFTIFVVVGASVATVKPYWILNRRWKGYATIAVFIVLWWFVPAPPNAHDEKPNAVGSAPVTSSPLASGAAASGPAKNATAVPDPGDGSPGAPVRIPMSLDTQDWAHAPTWEYMDDPQGEGKVGKSACVGSVEDSSDPETQGEVCISRLGKVVDAWIRDDDPKFTWGKKPALEIQFDGRFPETWDSEAGDPPEVGVLNIDDAEGFEDAAARGKELVIVVRFDGDATRPKVFRFSVAGLDVKQLLRR